MRAGTRCYIATASNYQSNKITERMQNERIYVAGHGGMVGSAITRHLQRGGANVITATHAELDLRDQRAVENFFSATTPTQVYLAAARVGGIAANDRYPADFVSDNLAIQSNVIDSA